MGDLDDFRDGVAGAVGDHHPAEAPTGHRPRLTKAVADDDPVVRGGDVQQGGRGAAAAIGQRRVDQAGIDLVGDQPDAVAAAEVENGREFVGSCGPTGGVVGRVEDEGAGAPKQGLETVEVQVKTAVFGGGRDRGCRPGRRGGGRHWPGWARRGRAARRGRRRGSVGGHCDVDGGHARAGDLDARLTKRDAVQGREMVRQRVPQGGHAAHVGVQGIASREWRRSGRSRPRAGRVDRSRRSRGTRYRAVRSRHGRR